MISPFAIILATLPIILPSWKEKPMDEQFLTYDTRGHKSTVELVQYQTEALKIEDPTLRMKTLSYLSLLSENEEASKVLYDFLETEKEPSLRVATLNYLYNMSVIEDRKNQIESLINNQVSEGIAAARLYARFKGAKLNKVFLLMKGTSVENKISLLNALSDSGRVPAQTWIQLSKMDDNMSYKNLALRGLGSTEKQTDNSLEFIKNVLQKGKDHEKVFIASQLVFNSETAPFFKMMAKDKMAVVRARAAAGMGAVIDKDFQSILINLSTDKDTEVRKKASQSLRHYPQQETVDALIKRFNDFELLNREKAAESILHISATFDVLASISNCLSGTAGYRRWSAFILGRLKVAKFAAEIEKLLKREKDQYVQVAQIYALGQVKHPIPPDLIKKLSKDKSPLVRAELMIYLGKLNDQKYFPFIDDAAMNDEANIVRWSALEACGISRSPWFNKTLFAIMEDLDIEDMRLANDRACACWAAGKIKGLSEEMYMRMRKAMKQPTIPQPMGPKTYDDAQVLISIIFAFVDQVKAGDDGDYDYAKWAKHFVFRFREDKKSIDFPRNYYNSYYSLQGLQYLNNEAVEPQEEPPRRVNWPVKPVRDK